MWALLQERVQAAEALRAEAQLKKATAERDYLRRLEAVRDSNRRKTLRDSLAWLRQAARTPHEANMHRFAPPPISTHLVAHVAAHMTGRVTMPRLWISPQHGRQLSQGMCTSSFCKVCGNARNSAYNTTHDSIHRKACNCSQYSTHGFTRQHKWISS